jgi:hypothetical protein
MKQRITTASKRASQFVSTIQDKNEFIAISPEGARGLDGRSVSRDKGWRNKCARRAGWILGFSKQGLAEESLQVVLVPAYTLARPPARVVDHMGGNKSKPSPSAR